MAGDMSGRVTAELSTSDQPQDFQGASLFPFHVHPLSPTPGDAFHDPGQNAFVSAGVHARNWLLPDDHCPSLPTHILEGELLPGHWTRTPRLGMGASTSGVELQGQLKLLSLSEAAAEHLPAIDQLVLTDLHAVLQGSAATSPLTPSTAQSSESPLQRNKSSAPGSHCTVASISQPLGAPFPFGRDFTLCAPDDVFSTPCPKFSGYRLDETEQPAGCSVRTPDPGPVHPPMQLLRRRGGTTTAFCNARAAVACNVLPQARVGHLENTAAIGFQTPSLGPGMTWLPLQGNAVEHDQLQNVMVSGHMKTYGTPRCAASPNALMFSPCSDLLSQEEVRQGVPWTPLGPPSLRTAPTHAQKQPTLCATSSEVSHCDSLPPDVLKRIFAMLPQYADCNGDDSGDASVGLQQSLHIVRSVCKLWRAARDDMVTHVEIRAHVQDEEDCAQKVGRLLRKLPALQSLEFSIPMTQISAYAQVLSAVPSHVTRLCAIRWTSLGAWDPASFQQTVGHVKGLKEFNLAHCVDAEGVFLQSVSRTFPSLCSLNMCDADKPLHMSKVCVRSITALPLTKLKLTKGYMVDDDTFPVLAGITTLTFLKVHFSEHTTGAAFQSIRNLKNLKVLHMHAGGFCDSDLQALESLKDIQVMSLNDMHRASAVGLSAVLRTLPALVDLQVLRCGDGEGHRVTMDTMHDVLSQLTQLTKIRVYDARDMEYASG